MKIKIFEDSWNHRRITQGSLLGSPRSPSRLVDLSKLLKSPRISNHEKRRFNVTSDPLLTHFPQFPCAGCTMDRHDFQSIVLLITLVKGGPIWCEALSVTAGWRKPGFQQTTLTQNTTSNAHFHGSIKCDQDQNLSAQRSNNNL